MSQQRPHHCCHLELPLSRCGPSAVVSATKSVCKCMGASLMGLVEANALFTQSIARLGHWVLRKYLSYGCWSYSHHKLSLSLGLPFAWDREIVRLVFDAKLIVFANVLFPAYVLQEVTVYWKLLKFVFSFVSKQDPFTDLWGVNKMHLLPSVSKQDAFTFFLSGNLFVVCETHIGLAGQDFSRDFVCSPSHSCDEGMLCCFINIFILALSL